MKFTILHNYSDCLLYKDGEAYHDIDESWAECILWFKDVIGLEVEMRHFQGHRSEFPNKIDLKA